MFHFELCYFFLSRGVGIDHEIDEMILFDGVRVR